MGGIDDWEIKEGETPPDLEGFLHYKKYPNPTREIVDELEEDNIRKAHVKYLASKPSLTKAPFDYPWFFQLHKEMLGEVYDWAGTQRQTNTSIGIDKYEIPQALMHLAQDIPYMPDNFDDPIEIAVRIHHRAVKIHPFKNGNGRFSRLLGNIWLRQNDLPLTEWPDISPVSPIRDQYLYAVKEADNMNYTPLIEMHKEHSGG